MDPKLVVLAQSFNILASYRKADLHGGSKHWQVSLLNPASEEDAATLESLGWDVSPSRHTFCYYL